SESASARSSATRIARRSALSGSGSMRASTRGSLKAPGPTDDTSGRMLRRLVLVLVVAACVFAPAAAAAANAPTPPGPGTGTPAKPAATSGASSWAAADIRTVVAQGLMGPDVATFRPQDPLTQADLAALVAGLTQQSVAPVSNPTATVTIAGLDSKLVRTLDLAPTAAEILQTARAAGLRPPTRFGTEVVARFLGLRFNHPAAHDDLELLPTDPATRAEAAYSAARIQI